MLKSLRKITNTTLLAKISFPIILNLTIEIVTTFLILLNFYFPILNWNYCINLILKP